MAYQNTDPTFIGQLQAGGAILRYSVVQLGASGVTTATAASINVGIAQEAVTAEEAAAGKPVTLQYNGASKCRVGANGVTVGAVCYAQADGSVGLSATTNRVGIALATAVSGTIAPVQLFL